LGLEAASHLTRLREETVHLALAVEGSTAAKEAVAVLIVGIAATGAERIAELLIHTHCIGCHFL